LADALTKIYNQLRTYNIMEETKESTSVMVTMSLDEYLSHARNRGQRFVTISDERRKEITSQHGWELECFVEEIAYEREILERLNKPVFKLWRLGDWQFHKETNRELVKETKIANHKEASANHAKLIAWKQSAISTLLAKARGMSLQDATGHINNCIDPVGRLSPHDFKDDTNLLTGEILKSKESKMGEKIKFYYQLRTKLNYPFSND
jgi:hypothetical protein